MRIRARARALERCQQREDLRLDRDIERGGRLIGDQKFRLRGQRQGHHGALAQAAGELVRVLTEAARRIADLHLLQERQGRRARGRR